MTAWNLKKISNSEKNKVEKGENLIKPGLKRFVIASLFGLTVKETYLRMTFSH